MIFFNLDACAIVFLNAFVMNFAMKLLLLNQSIFFLIGACLSRVRKIVFWKCFICIRFCYSNFYLDFSQKHSC